VKSLLAGITLTVCLWGQTSNAPDYTSAGVVNAASFTAALAPNTLASIFGTNLSWSTRAIGAADIAGGALPMALANVEVFVGGYQAHLMYVSSTQINFLIPAGLRPGDGIPLFVDRQGVHGPAVALHLDPAAPALFEMPPALLPAATHLDGSLVTQNAPARAGEIVVLYGTGLGYVYSPALGCLNDGEQDGVFPTAAEWLCNMDQFGVSLGGVLVDPKLIWYAGVTPGYAGLYQVNLQLPDPIAPNPELRLVMGGYKSPAGMILPVQ
jgi:uncharacterized protein (TIGR03437 family)